jgi:Carboxypeptidase regulatory-like domain
LFAGAHAAPAQVTTGYITGTVQDGQGGVIPGAAVTLISEARGTRSAPTLTGPSGDFVFPNVSVDTYTIEVVMDSFKTLRRPGVAVSAGSRVAVGVLTIEIGVAAETVEVKGEAPVIQAASGERSFTIPTESVQNLPLANRSFTALAQLAPGVTGTSALGTRANMSTNFTMDGISTMDTGSNTVMLQMNTESIAEVKLLVSGYQAEYGRSSGLQVMAVTKSGTNQFRGSFYDVERNSDWDSNSKQNVLNGLPKTVSKQRDIGYSIGGPIGKPGGRNKLFFFNSAEFRPRTAGNDQQIFRMPTELERRGDFSQTVDVNGAPYPYIKDPQLPGACNATTQAGCFADGGVVGRIPQNRLYQPGLALLNMWPLPGGDSTIPGTNLQYIRPTEKTLSYQPAVRFDYQALPSLRISYKYQGQIARQQVNQGSIPGWNDTVTPYTGVGTDAASVNYNLNQTTFLEGTIGRAWNKQGSYQVNEISDARMAGLANLPLLFPNANIINPAYYGYWALNTGSPTAPYWDGTRVYKVPNFTWGNRITSNTVNGPPNVGLNNLREHPTWDLSVSLTKVAGRHTFKAGYYSNHSLKRESVSVFGTNFGTINFGNDTANPFDTSFGFANAAIGSFTEFQQGEEYIEGSYTFDNREFYVQDNWKATGKLTLDYGVRFVNATPLYDNLLQGGNFLPEQYSMSDAPAVYVYGCANGVSPCTGNNRQAMNPVTGQFLGPNTNAAVGTIVAGTGRGGNGLFAAGQGIAETSYTFPTLVFGPRFGLAYDVTGTQTLVLRGSVGTYFDRPRPGDAQALAANTVDSVSVRYSQLQTLGSGGLTTQGARQLTAYQYDAKLPTATAWNVGMQTMLPWSISFDAAYTGRHNYNAQVGGQDFPININTIDIGSAFRPDLQDPTLPPSAVAGASSLAAQNPNQIRGYRGYGNITYRQYDGWRTFHSTELAMNRRFQNGLQFGFSDTIVISDVLGVDPRYDHGPDGQVVLRADQADAQELLGNQNTPRHNMRATFVWQLPQIPSPDNQVLKVLRLIANDWQLSGVWTGTSGSSYTVTQQYQTGNANVNLTGSPDFAPRIRIVGDTGDGCSSDPYRQFNTAAFQGPLVGSVGLESGNGYLFGCFQSALDLSIARNIRLGGNRTLQFRVDMFNAPNQARPLSRNTQLQLSSPADPVTPLNLPFDANGDVLPNRVRPNQAGFGAVQTWQAPRTIQAYIRFGF